MLIKSGMLVEIINASDQDMYTKSFVGRIGIVIENVKPLSSPNIWKILLGDGKSQNFHRLDLKPVTTIKQTEAT